MAHHGFQEPRLHIMLGRQPKQLKRSFVVFGGDGQIGMERAHDAAEAVKRCSIRQWDAYAVIEMERGTGAKLRGKGPLLLFTAEAIQAAKA